MVKSATTFCWSCLLSSRAFKNTVGNPGKAGWVPIIPSGHDRIKIVTLATGVR